MSNLFFRTLSQSLQGLTPIAVSLVWFEAIKAQRVCSAIRRGVIASFPATIVAAALFQLSERRALEELVLAVATFAAAGALVWMVARPDAPTPRSPSLLLLVSAATILVIVRQTMEIGAIFMTAAVHLRSFPATSDIVTSASLGAAAAWLWVQVGRRSSIANVRRSTKAFFAAFLPLLGLYIVHESAEARLIPFSDVVHTATEPYGPDGMYGVHFAYVLVALPLVIVAWSHLRPIVVTERTAGWARSVRDGAAAASTVLAACVLLSVQSTDAHPLPIAQATVAELRAASARPHFVFRNTAPGRNFGRVAIAPLDAPDQRLTTGLWCERVSFAGGRGLCLHTDHGLFNSYTAILFGGDFIPGATLKLQGLPSRTRIAATGTVGAMTVFVTGDDYASAFSTRTTVVDVATGDEIGDLEEFATWRDGVRFKAVDFNFWGVTFARDANVFFASLRTAGRTYLVRGELGLRKLTVVRGDAECPSLSPDGRMLAYKKRIGPSPDAWRLHVLDLSTNVERMIQAETRYIDDQVEWLDSKHVLYAIPRRMTAISDVWAASIDGTEAPRIVVSQAESPIVIR